MNTQLISGRIYGAILALAAASLAIGGGLLLYWCANGFPPEFLRATEMPPMDRELLLGFKAIGWFCLVLAAVNVVFSVFAFRGHLWPLVASTVGWSLFLAPTLAHPSVATIVLLATLLGLTAVAVVSRYSDA